MAETRILSLEEFLKRAELDPGDLESWMKRGLLLAAGRTSGGEPYFTAAQLEVVKKIRTLMELGYDEGGIEKIVRKVGLPSDPRDEQRVPQKLMTVGELAQKCSINTRAVNHWEEKGLIEAEARSEGGFRLYGPASVLRCRRILDLQNLGYSLEQIKAARQVLEDPQGLCARLKKRLRRSDVDQWKEQDAQLKERIEEVRVSLKRLEELWKQRSRLGGTLKAQYEKSAREKKKQAVKPAPAKA